LKIYNTQVSKPCRIRISFPEPAKEILQEDFLN
jgi:hypothetical protein